MDKTLKIGTFNIRWANPDDGEHTWDRRKARLFDALRDWNPDVLGVQEPRAGQLDDLREALPAYDSVAVGRDDGKRAGEFCPIFFRRERLERVTDGTFWFSETPDVPGSQSWGSHHPRLCTWAEFRERGTDETFRVYNLHWDHESQQARENSARLLLDHFQARAHAGPVIVLGDFNAEADNPAVTALTAPGSPVPISALTLEQSAQTGTFHGFTGQHTSPPIDHILLSPEWEVLSAEVLRGDGNRPFLSDHFPLAATLQRRTA